jgi:hypothetical protein
MVGHGFPSPSAAETLPSLLNPLFLTLRTPLTGEDCRWGYVWLLMEEQYLAMAIIEKLDTWCHNHLHATWRANQLPECSCPQPIRTCHVLVCTHNSCSMCYLLLCNSFKTICHFKHFLFIKLTFICDNLFQSVSLVTECLNF